ncbi:MAG: hypothetical protein HYU02_05905 [Thaumarchaeota archaeon]|nr:hypothetical protein [Nitrososphaerota archaeon]
MKQSAAFVLIAVGIVAVVSVLGIQYSATKPSSSAPEPSPLISSLPITRSTPTANPPPRPIPPEIRCNWFVICGKYIILKDHGDYKTGDYLRLSELGFADMSGDREVYSKGRRGCPSNPLGYPAAGRWHAERTAVPGSEYYTHTVTFESIGILCKLVFANLRWNVEASFNKENGAVDVAKLVCNDGSTWVLCNGSVELREYMKEYCKERAAEIIAYVNQTKFIMPPSGAINLTFVINSEMSGAAMLVVMEQRLELMYPNWEMMKMPSGFSVEGGEKRVIGVNKGQRIELPIKIITANATEGTYRLSVLVYYQIRSDWKNSGSAINVTVQR